MDTQRRWIGYDTFKLIVALILLLLLVFLLLQPPAPLATGANEGNPVGTGAATQTQPAPTEAAPLQAADQATATQPAEPSITPTTVLPTTTLPPVPTATQVPPTATPEPTAIPATPTPDSSAQTAATETPPVEATATETAAPTATPQPQAAAGSPGDCPLAQPSRLATGQQAVVVANLNLREAAGMDKRILRVSLPNARVEIVGGPICIPHQNGAYLWWNVKTADGTTGWSAEAALSKNFYFLQPAP